MFGSECVTESQNCWNLQKSTFILLFCHSEPNWVGKSQFQSYLRFWDCLLTPWLPTTSILILIGRIYHYQFKCSYLKNLELSSLSISKVIDSKRHAYLNAKKVLFIKTLWRAKLSWKKSILDQRLLDFFWTRWLPTMSIYEYSHTSRQNLPLPI